MMETPESKRKITQCLFLEGFLRIRSAGPLLPHPQKGL